MTLRRLRFLMAILTGHWGWTMIGLFFALLSAVSNIALLAISGWFITGMAVAGAIALTAAGATAVGFNYLVPSAIIRACAIGRSGGRYLERLLTHDASLRVIATLRPRMFAALAREPALTKADPGSLDDAHSGSQAGTLGGDLDTLQRFYLQIAVPALVAALIGVPIILISTLMDATTGAILFTAFLFGGLMIPWSLAAVGARPGWESQRLRSRLRVLVGDAVRGREELMAFDAVTEKEAILQEVNRSLARVRARIAFQDALGAAILPALANFTMWAVVIALGPELATGQISGLSVVMLAFLALASFELLAPLPEAFQRLGATNTVLDRVMSLRLSSSTPPENRPLFAYAAPPTVRFEGVTLAPLTPGAPAPLSDFSLVLEPGRKVALVGASGAGKTSVTRLLTGSIPWKTGQIWVDDHVVSGDDDPTFEALVALSPQRPDFLSDTLRRNLQIARTEATYAELAEALETVCLTPWLEGLPDGFDTLIGEGGRALSGGEAKRLSIARALLGPGPILVLDEPGEGLDPALETKVIERVIAAAGDRTVLLITHRARGLELMDQVVVMDGGHVLQRGAPFDLAITDGPFRRFLQQAAV